MERYDERGILFLCINGREEGMVCYHLLHMLVWRLVFVLGGQWAAFLGHDTTFS